MDNMSHRRGFGGADVRIFAASVQQRRQPVPESIQGVIGTLGGHLVASVDDIELLLHQAVGGKLISL